MLVEQGAQHVVVLCNFKEQGKDKCHPYWPRVVGETLVHGIYTVRLIKSEKMQWERASSADVTLYQLVVEVDCVVVHSFQLAHWQNWPDRSAPQPDSALLELLSRISDTKKPIVVHCSAGVGRTGVFALTMMIIERLQSGHKETIESAFNLIGLLRELRSYRANSVQTVAQYLYVIQIILTNCLQSGILEDSFRDEVNSFTIEGLKVAC
ncbi:unnamed protein product, partial [Mesorhabditis spiculigera]